MKDGFLKLACATPALRVADCPYNADEILSLIREADANGAKLLIFPELCLTGYTCADLFFQASLLRAAEAALDALLTQTQELELVFAVGLPVSVGGKLYNCAAVCQKGSVLGTILKSHLPNYGEFQEQRFFTEAPAQALTWHDAPFSRDLRFVCADMPEFSFGVEICEDLWVGDSPSVNLAKQGATIIANLSASDETIGKAAYRRKLLEVQSGTLFCTYLYAGAGIGESTTDLVFAGHNLIAENGTVLAEAKRFSEGLLYAVTDLGRLAADRRRTNTFCISTAVRPVSDIPFSLTLQDTDLTGRFSDAPFVPALEADLHRRCTEILEMQAVGLMTRLRHIGCKDAVLGLSGGLDSTLALIVAVHAFDLLKLPRAGILAVTMPCFGTTDRTYQNACRLAKAYGVTLREIGIRESVMQHFADIGQSPDAHDVTYENAQARERTQVLMDLANQRGGIVIGTGDLSELALGWATYNGDHMSMYGVNASIPKTLVRYLVRHTAEQENGALQAVLLDVLDTPVSPELLPPSGNGTISQKTEDLIGPYALHDFFLYHMLRFGTAPQKLYRMACAAFDGQFDCAVILQWEKTFYRRFFSQQFKRSCLPDGVKVGSVTLSPRGDWRMPSDACVRVWMDELNAISKA